MINLALEAKPDDMVITMHICRGNLDQHGLLQADMNQLQKFYLGIVMLMVSS